MNIKFRHCLFISLLCIHLIAELLLVKDTLVLPPVVFAAGPTKTINYQIDNSLFPNPERGYYASYNPYCCSTNQPHPPFTLQDLQRHRNRYEKITLVNDRIQIGQFMNSDISQEYLNRLQSDFDTIRAAGMKTVVRFLYDWSINNRDPDKATVMRHLDQLIPLIQKNADVIAWVQGGLYGGSGEANGSDHGYVSQNLDHVLSQDGVEIYVKWFRGLPQDRMMAFRYPRLTLDMQRYSFPQYNWTATLSSRTFDLSKNLTEQQAFSGIELSRMGFYSDGYLGNENHWAMFVMTNESAYSANQTKYVIFEGEMSGQTDHNSTDNVPVRDMEKYHTTGFNRDISDGQSIFENVWAKNGDLEETARRLGYRFSLISATIPESFAANENFSMSMVMRNDGFARIINPRKVEIILRNSTNGQKYVMNIDNGKGNRLWLPGPAEQKNLTINTPLPANIPNGNYEVILNLPDPYPSLHDRPEYSIRLANVNTWEANTGYNKLNHTLAIGGSTGGNPTPTPDANQTEICAADLNVDGAVDLVDYSFMLSQFFRKVSEGASSRNDLNGDGIIDVSDYGKHFPNLVKYFNQICNAHKK